MPFLAAGPDITPITDLISTWTHIAQALVASIGALAFIFALAWMSITLPPARQTTWMVTLQTCPRLHGSKFGFAARHSCRTALIAD